MFNCFVTCSFSFRLLLVLCCLFRNAGKTQQWSNSPRSWIVMLQRDDFEKWLFQQKIHWGFSSRHIFLQENTGKVNFKYTYTSFSPISFEIIQKTKLMVTVHYEVSDPDSFTLAAAAGQASCRDDSSPLSIWCLAPACPHSAACPQATVTTHSAPCATS